MFDSVHITAALLRGVRQHEVVDKLFYRFCCADQLRFPTRFWDIAPQIRHKMANPDTFSVYARVMRHV